MSEARRPTAREQRQLQRRHGRRRRRGGERRAPVAVQRAARAVHATGDGTRRVWGAARRGDRPMVVAVLIVLALGVAMISGPAQRYLDSSARVESLEAKAEALEKENARLEQRKQDLTDDEYVELLAREQHDLIRPGEVPYTLVPPEVERPRIQPPRDVVEPPDPAWYERAWRTVAGWLQ